MGFSVDRRNAGMDYWRSRSHGWIQLNTIFATN